MKDYFYSLIIASVTGTVCALLTKGGFEKYIKYITALICTIILISPLSRKDFSSAAQEYRDALELLSREEMNNMYGPSDNLARQRAEEYITEVLFEKFGIKPHYCNINIDWNSNEPTVKSIEVGITSQTEEQRKQIKAHLENLLGGEVKVIEG